MAMSQNRFCMMRVRSTIYAMSRRSVPWLETWLGIHFPRYTEGGLTIAGRHRMPTWPVRSIRQWEQRLEQRGLPALILDRLLFLPWTDLRNYNGMRSCRKLKHRLNAHATVWFGNIPIIQVFDHIGHQGFKLFAI